MNTGSTSANVTLTFYDEGGNPVSLPVVFVQSVTTAPTSLATVTRALSGGATLILQTGGQPNLAQGSVQLTSDGAVSGFIFFRLDATGGEAVVPLETRNPSAFVLGFDNTVGYATGVAVANVSAQPANIQVIIRDDTGVNFGTDTITLPGHGHISFVMTDRYGITAKIRGTLEIQTPVNRGDSVIGIRSKPSVNSSTTIPPLAK